jgi:hypothetical protein
MVIFFKIRFLRGYQDNSIPESIACHMMNIFQSCFTCVSKCPAGIKLIRQAAYPALMNPKITIRKKDSATTGEFFLKFN